jgi:hypothetical protein
MSADDPTDDELEREAARDIPSALGGTRHHAPKLEAVSRAIDLREMRPLLEAEREASDSRMGSARGGPEYVPPGYPGPGRRHASLPVAKPEMDRIVHSQRSASPLGSALRPQAPAATRVLIDEEAAAWDRYVAAALPIVANQQLPEAAACAVADVLLEERRRRFT